MSVDFVSGSGSLNVTLGRASQHLEVYLMTVLVEDWHMPALVSSREDHDIRTLKHMPLLLRCVSSH